MGNSAAELHPAKRGKAKNFHKQLPTVLFNSLEYGSIRSVQRDLCYKLDIT